MSKNVKIEQARVSAEKKYKEQLDFQQSLKTILKYSKKFEDSFLELSTNGNHFANELSNLSRKEYIAQSPQLSQFLFQYASSMGNLASVRNQMVDTIRLQFDEYVTQFADYDFNDLADKKSKMDHAASAYDVHLTKIDDLSKKGKLDEQKLAAYEAELDSARKTVDSTTVDFYAAMDYVNENKDWKILRYLYQHLEMQVSYFQMAHKLYTNTMTKMDPVKKYLDHLDHTSSHRFTVEGYLLKKRSAISGDKRHWLVLKDGHLSLLQGKKKTTMDMRLCTVRPTPQNWKDKDKKSDKDKPAEVYSPPGREAPTPFQLSFEIISHNKKPIILQAESLAEKDKWIKALNASISSSLNNSTFIDTKESSNDSAARAFKILRNVPGNVTCVDCDAKDPDWASINLGVTVCLECSGVHRSLGVHITKVRSLTLDKWDPELVYFMKKAGNDLVNSIYEYNLGNFEKPTQKTDRESREAFIKAKYVTKQFIPPCMNPSGLNESNMKLLRSQPDNVHDLLLHLAQGADVNYPMPHAVNQGNTLFVTCLLQNGALLSGNFQANLTLDDVEHDREGNIAPTTGNSSGTDTVTKKSSVESYEDQPQQRLIGSVREMQRASSHASIGSEQQQQQMFGSVKQKSTSSLPKPTPDMLLAAVTPPVSTSPTMAPHSAKMTPVKKPLPSTPQLASHTAPGVSVSSPPMALSPIPPPLHLPPGSIPPPLHLPLSPKPAPGGMPPRSNSSNQLHQFASVPPHLQPPPPLVVPNTPLHLAPQPLQTPQTSQPLRPSSVRAKPVPPPKDQRPPV